MNSLSMCVMCVSIYAMWTAGEVCYLQRHFPDMVSTVSAACLIRTLVDDRPYSRGHLERPKARRLETRTNEKERLTLEIEALRFDNDVNASLRGAQLALESIEKKTTSLLKHFAFVLAVLHVYSWQTLSLYFAPIS